MSGVVEEVDEGYLETGTNLVSVVSTLSPLSYHRCCLTGLICNVSNRHSNCRLPLGCCLTQGKSTFKMCFLLFCSNWLFCSHKLGPRAVELSCFITENTAL